MHGRTIHTSSHVICQCIFCIFCIIRIRENSESSAIRFPSLLRQLGDVAEFDVSLALAEEIAAGVWLEKSHCGERHICSISMCFAASSVRRLIVLFASPAAPRPFVRQPGNSPFCLRNSIIKRSKSQGCSR